MSCATLGAREGLGVSVEPAPGAKPFERERVNIAKCEYIELKWQAHYWRRLHEQALQRIKDGEGKRREERAGWAVRETQLRAEGQEAAERWQAERAEGAARETQLKEQLQQAQAQIRDLRQRLFGRKTEQAAARQGAVVAAGRRRGQQRGRRGHGRTRAPQLPMVVEDQVLAGECPRCGLVFERFPGTQDAEVLEVEVRAYRRVIRRHRYRPTCRCPLPGIVVAAAPAQLIPRGKLGISIWVELLLAKFRYGQPIYRLLQNWHHLGLEIAPGTVTEGLQTLLPYFVPLREAGLTRLREAGHWHADETRWEVFEACPGKVGHRWYLWVFQSATVTHFELDPSRSAAVPAKTLAGRPGVLSVDRFSAYRKYARLHPGVELALCWAHQRRDLLQLANDHPALSAWAMTWVDAIAQLYHLHDQRRRGAAAALPAADGALRAHLTALEQRRDAGLADLTLAAPARKVLNSMQAHWPGLVCFLAHPTIDLDNNAAERALRPMVVGRKNFYGSGSQWAGELAVTMMSLFVTAQQWGLNLRTWLTAYLRACAEAGGQAPADCTAFVPWTMTPAQRTLLQGLDSS